MENDKFVRLSTIRGFFDGCNPDYPVGIPFLLSVFEQLSAVDAVEVSGATKQAIALIVEERRRQTAEWGDQSDINPFEFMSILGEEFGELCQAVNETLFVNPKHPERGGFDAIVCEAVQVGAVAAQIIEACMRG